ncbi:C40 family peptidase [Actinomadura sp. K4S16]|uniref:C40 family peptidase n=1 Tax=Actinomadura sp. K4S16 TaxID=1316147 RepID=UPI00280BE919|nr:C40 family peptidase [Actinomadura sp. K4S16]
MLQRLMSGRSRNGDRGAATTTVIVGMALLLVAGLLLFSRVAHANDLRTKAQTGADAAALGTLTPLRDQAVGLALEGIDPSGAGYWLVDGSASDHAKVFANKNNSQLIGEAHLTGLFGNTAKVKTRTNDCQLKRKEELTDKEKDDLKHHRNLCTDTGGKKGIGRFGTATAIAKVFYPECHYEYDPQPPDNPADPTGGAMTGKLICGNGVQAFPNGNREQVERLFRVRLVDREDPVQYTGLPDGLGGPAGGGPAVVSECIKTGKKPEDSLSFGARVVAWALCWQGTPYSWGGGTYSGPSYGICCSPGGYSGAHTLGFDCSGLTMYAVYQASHGKIALGHFTGSQVSDSRGQRVSTSALQPGDLIFFGAYPTHHVAIYYGDNKMVEAPQTGSWVKISTLRSPSYAMRFNG